MAKDLAISIDNAAAEEDWDRVIELTANCWGDDFQTYYRNLAFAHKGLLADSLMHHYTPFENALFYPIQDKRVVSQRLQQEKSGGILVTLRWQNMLLSLV